MKYKEKYQKAEKTANIWKQRYEALQEKYLKLKEKAQPYLDAMEFAADTVRAFLDAVLRKRENVWEHKTPALRRGQERER